MYSNVRSCKL